MRVLVCISSEQSAEMMQT